MGVSTGIQNITFGTTGATAAYLGDTLIWPLCRTEEVYGIKASGITNNYILLPFNTSTTLRVEVKFKVLQQNGGVLLGGNTGQDNNDYRVFYTGGRYFCDVGSGRAMSATIGISGATFEIGNLYIKDMVNGVTIVSGATKEAPRSQYRVNIGYLEFYWLKAYDDGAMIFDGVAAKDCDGYYGIMDKMTGNFYKATEDPSAVEEINEVTEMRYLYTNFMIGYYDPNMIYLNFNTHPSLRFETKFFMNTYEWLRWREGEGPYTTLYGGEGFSLKYYNPWANVMELYWCVGENSAQIPKPPEFYDYEFGNNYVKESGVTVYSGETQSSVQSSRFGINLELVNVYPFKVYAGNTLIFDGIPALINEKYGLYDKVSHEAFYPQNQDHVSGRIIE